MTDDADLVALRVAEVRAIVVRMVLRPHARRTLRNSAIGQCDAVDLINHGASLGKEGNHLTVAYCVGLFVVGHADEEQWPGFRMRLPARPRARTLAEALLNAKDRHKRSVEGKSALEITDTDEDV